MSDALTTSLPADNGARRRSRRALGMAFGLTATGLVAEAIGGWWSGSLALWSDAAHMLTDSIALAIGFVACRVALRPATPAKTYGLLRMEILAALLNGVILIPVAGGIVIEAVRRYADPPEIRAGPMMAVALVGLAINCVCAVMLFRSQAGSLNVRGAFFHVVGDTLGSVGTLIAGALIAAFGWRIADPLVSVGIAGLILVGAWNLVRESTEILLEGTPAHIELLEVQEALLAVEGVKSLHDLHVWTLTSGTYSMSCHVVVEGDRARQGILESLAAVCRDRFRIEHTTIQLEETSLEHSEARVH
ncbi:MAG: cation transporter [Planctomycetes bacterium]|nr:cation transporter [Planctomycetota bacterium]